ncbi:MAG: hypothetical protein Q9226_003712, partial [Calogaya cf. arnoldii]
MDDFVFLNPGINSNCTNLLADESYCVQAVGDINTYSGRAGYNTATATQGPITDKYTDLPDATYVSPTAISTLVPLANGTRADCNYYFNGDVFQNDITNTNWKSKCELAASTYDVNLGDFGGWTCQGILRVYELTIAQFFAYNPAVKSDCSGLWSGYKYCIRDPDYEASTTVASATPVTSDVGLPPATATGPVQSGQPSNCNKWYTIK